MNASSEFTTLLASLSGCLFYPRMLDNQIPVSPLMTLQVPFKEFPLSFWPFPASELSEI